MWTYNILLNICLEILLLEGLSEHAYIDSQQYDWEKLNY